MAQEQCEENIVVATSNEETAASRPGKSKELAPLNARAAPATESKSYKRTAEWRRYKVLRAIGWPVLGLGIPTTFTGIICAVLQEESGGPTAAIISVGGVLLLSSIPLLVCAYHNRRKALRMRVTTLHSPEGRQNVAVTFALSF